MREYQVTTPWKMSLEGVWRRRSKRTKYRKFRLEIAKLTYFILWIVCCLIISYYRQSIRKPLRKRSLKEATATVWSVSWPLDRLLPLSKPAV